MRWLGVVFFFLVAAVVQTWPLVWHAGDQTMHYPSQPGDTAVFLWDLWWMKEALVVLQSNPFHTDYLFFPQGTDLYLHPLNPLNGILSIPLQLITGNLLLSWNILALTFLILSGVGTYALVRRITGNDVAAMLSGFVFAFAPATLMHLQGGQWNISTTWPLPFFALFVLRLSDAARLRDVLGAAVLGAAITYNWIEFGLDAVLFLALFIAFSSLRNSRTKNWRSIRDLWGRSAAVLTVWGILCLPLAIAAWRNIHREGYEIVTDVEYWSADLSAFVTRSPLWGAGKDPIYPIGPHLGVGSPLGTWYLGLVPLGLAVIGIVVWKQGRFMALFWTAVLLLFVILSLGPHLFIDGDKSFSLFGTSFSVPLPYQLYDELPAFGDRRIPARMMAFALLALSVLAGIGCAAILQLLQRRWPSVVPAAAVLLLAIVILDYWSPPVSLSEMSTPSALERIGSESGDFSVLQLPLGRAAGATVAGDTSGGYIVDYYQTIYKKRSFGGYIARGSSPTVAWIASEPGLRYLACTTCTPEQTTTEDLDPVTIRAGFDRHRIKYVIIHKTYPDLQPVPLAPDTIAKWDAYLRDVAGLEAVSDEGELSIYRNPRME